jgi:hypothetical protein
MQCEDIRNHFADYLADRLEASATSGVLQHLSSCPGCQAEADALEMLWSGMGTVPEAVPDMVAMENRFGKMLDTYAQGVKSSAPTRRRRIVPALVLMATVAIGLYAGQRSGLLPVMLHLQAPPPPQVSPVAPAPANPALEVATLEGVAIRQGTNEPVPNARIVLGYVDPPGTRQGVREEGGKLILPPATREPVTLKTDARGLFVLRDIQPGQYRLFASRDGYLKAEYGQRKADGPGAPLDLAPGQRLANVRLVMTPTAAVAGHVFNSDREPFAGVAVKALRFFYGPNGKPAMEAIQTARTNDLGEYRLYWLPPGPYVISAMPVARAFLDSEVAGGVIVDRGPGYEQSRTRYSGATAAAMGIVTVEQTGEAYLPVYFSGTNDADAASRIDLQPGANITGVDLTVPEVRAVRIRGRVTNGATGQPANGASVLLIPKRRGMAARSATVTPTGTFDLSGVPPGSYQVVAVLGGEAIYVDPTGGIGVGGDEDKAVPRLAAYADVTVGMEDLSGIALTLQRGFEIKGRITIEGQTPSNNEDIWQNTNIVFDTDPYITGVGQVRTAVAPDGTFTLSGVIPAGYRFRTENSPRNTYWKSVRLGNAEVMNSVIQIDREPQGMLEVVLRPNPATVAITAVSDGRAAIEGLTVVLVPDQLRRGNQYMYENGITDSSGRVQFTGVVPGEYKIFAWEDAKIYSWMDPDFIRNFEAQGKLIRIDEAGNHTFEVTPIPGR